MQTASGLLSILHTENKLFFGACLSLFNRLVGLVVKASASRAEDPGFESRLQLDYSGVEFYQ